jgi:hypothetical protein
MDPTPLLDQARRLTPPPPQAVAEYQGLLENLVTDLNARLLKDPSLDSLIGGAANRPVLWNNNHNHAKFVATLLADYQPETLVETLRWVLDTYLSRGFRSDFFPFVLARWKETLRSQLSPSSLGSILPFYDFMSMAVVALAEARDKESAP